MDHLPCALQDWGAIPRSVSPCAAQLQSSSVTALLATSCIPPTHRRKGDVYCHADLHGASSTIVKNHRPEVPIPPLTLAQVRGGHPVLLDSVLSTVRANTFWCRHCCPAPGFSACIPSIAILLVHTQNCTAQHWACWCSIVLAAGARRAPCPPEYLTCALPIPTLQPLAGWCRVCV